MKSRSIKISFFMILMVCGFITTGTFGAEHVFQSLEDAKWVPASPAIPPGAVNVVLSGNPMEDSPFTLLVKFPANYQVAAHSHPKNENVSVISGTLYLGMGDKLDASGGKGLGAGGYALMPANMNHYVYTKAETIFLVYGQGPVEFKYVNPADDPRNKK